MDNHNIAIIVNRNNEKYVNVFEESLKNVVIPEGYNVEIIELREEKNIARSYNEAMHKSDAGIKIYIKDGVLFVNPMILQMIIDIFDGNKNLGLLGLSGVKQMPTNGLQYKAEHRTGKILLGQDAAEIKWENDEDNQYTEVMAADKYFLVTQYDVEWREDLFCGGEYYEASQSLEFLRNGYKVGVASQESPWVWSVDYEDADVKDEERQVFLEEYSKDCFPLVSIIIPTYNRPVYFEEALKSALNQTYKNLDIFITDNSTDNRTEELIQKYLHQDSRITYVHNEATDADGNWLCARKYNNSEAEYAKYLMDDDILCPTQIERMIQVFFDYPTVSLVTSYRRLIDKNGSFLPDYNFNRPFADEDTLVSGEKMGRLMLGNNKNLIGEPTTVLMKKRCLRNNDLGWTGKEGKYLHYLMPDYQTFLRLLMYGDLYYIAEPLSYFRWHEKQGQKEIDTMINGAIGWAIEIEYAWKNKLYLKTKKDYKLAMASWIKETAFTLQMMIVKGINSEDSSKLNSYLVKATEAITGL